MARGVNRYGMGVGAWLLPSIYLRYRNIISSEGYHSSSLSFFFSPKLHFILILLGLHLPEHHKYGILVLL